ncbi:MAG: TraR/DksA C4-type zinc finger protein [Bacteroidota bacterium]
MATKKKVVKAKKAVAKPAKKPASNKKAVAPLKKSAVKPVAKSVKKTIAAPAKSKPAANKIVAKKPVVAPKKAVAVKTTAAVKTVAKPVAAKPAVKVVKPEATKAAPVSKPVIPPVKATIPPPPSKANTPKTMIMTEKNNGPEKSRYSDTELKEFKVLIIAKLDEARTELINLNAAIISANENGTDDTGASFKMLEDGSDTLAKEEAAQLAARQKKFIEQLEAALIRIENKTYGVCRVTGKLIPKERLRAVPHTTQSMEAKLQQYKD